MRILLTNDDGIEAEGLACLERIARSLPSLIQTPEGRAQIVAVMRQGAQQNIADAQRSSAAR